MKVYTAREVHKFLRKTGWEIIGYSGDHIKYRKNGRMISVPCNKVNRMLIQRLNKEFNLGLF